MRCPSVRTRIIAEDRLAGKEQCGSRQVLPIGRLVVVFGDGDGDGDVNDNVNDNVNERMGQAVPCG
ncbi:MAG: hypothetical protein FJ109_14525 [Deltaproteobacteria bacterium]|nr:hypothetical protein [Deltaproteobacteria bacterium]